MEFIENEKEISIYGFMERVFSLNRYLFLANVMLCGTDVEPNKFIRASPSTIVDELEQAYAALKRGETQKASYPDVINCTDPEKASRYVFGEDIFGNLRSTVSKIHSGSWDSMSAQEILDAQRFFCGLLEYASCFRGQSDDDPWDLGVTRFHITESYAMPGMKEFLGLKPVPDYI